MARRIKFNSTKKIIILIIFIVLTIPLLEQLDGKATFHWTIFDFLLAFILLSCLGFGIEYLFRKITSKKVMLLVIMIFIFLFVLVWAELAVGIFNTPFAGD